MEIEALKTAIEGARFDGLDLHWLGRESHVESQVWLADVLRRINDHPASRIDELLPWNWKKRHETRSVSATELQLS